MSRPDTSPTAQSPATRQSRRASAVADQIVADLAAMGWPTDTVVGSESELLERYGVSRAVFREAVRLLEHLQVARMRRGPGGGLMVMAPSVESAIDAASVYLYFVGAEIEEVFDARLTLEEMAAELAPHRLDELHISELRELVAGEAAGEVHDHRELHRLVSAVTGNPALVFFVEFLNRVTLLYLPSAAGLARSTLSESAAAHAAIVDSIVRGDAARARHRMRKHLMAETEFLRRRRPSRRRLADLPDIIGRSDKRAEQIARQVFREVAAAGWPAGDLLGSEAELMRRYGVSRAVLREAVRMLEHHQVARMRRGPGGGLFVTEPGVDAVTEAIALQMDRLSIRPHHLNEVRAAVEMRVLDLVIDRFDDEVAAALAAALDHERTAPPEQFSVVGHHLHGVLAGVCGNRVLELLVLVLIRLTQLHATAPPKAPRPQAEVSHVHERIVEAIVGRDVELARHRMRRHLDAMERWVR